MIIDTPDGPKFEWELEHNLGPDESAVAASAPDASAGVADHQIANKEKAVAQFEQKQRAMESTLPIRSAVAPSAIDPSIVALAQNGEVECLRKRLRAGCIPDVFAFEYDLYPGGSRMYCNDWTPLTAAAAAGQLAAVLLLLETRASVNILCCASTSSGAYRSWTALDCARTGDAIPFERDPARASQPKHAEVEQLLLAAGGLPSSALPEPRPLNTYGYPPAEGQRPNPCLDSQGLPLKPAHLYDEAQEELRRRHPGMPRLRRTAGGGGCPTTSLGLPLGPLVASGPGAAATRKDRVYSGGCRAYG